MFFILSMGRAGTMMLSELLNGVQDVVVKHEPDSMDVKLVGLRHGDSFGTSLDGLLRARFDRVRALHPQAAVYGEVNSYLRYEAEWLRSVLDARVLFVCRDGRDFVRSAFGRTIYTDRDGQMTILPRDDDPASADWSRYDRFEKLCWYWAHTNAMLLDQIGDPIQMERALNDYEYFESRILKELDLEISKDVWSAEVSRPRNTSRANARKETVKRLLRMERSGPRPTLSHWSKWDVAQTERFWEIAGPVMERLGYSR
ncbi:MAG: hypothetical protein AB8G23_06350 [Myxococcota bacterium]